MTKYLMGVLLWVATLSIAFSNCDTARFRWLCRIPVQAKSTPHTPSVIDCNGTNVYVTPAQYETIMRNQRASINMTLKVNGEYVTSPCVPAGYTGLGLH